MKKQIQNLTKCIDGKEWAQRIEALPRVGTQNVTAFYEHRIGAICTDTRYLLVPLDDHLVHRGDGIFESLTLAYGKILELDAHIERLQRSAKRLGITLPLSWEEVRKIIIDVSHIGGAQHGSLKILVGRGEGGMGISPKECPEASFYCVASKGKVLPVSFWEKGLTACRSSVPAKQEYMAQIKSTNYLPNVFMAQEAEARGVDVSVSFDINGYLAEAAIANVAIVDKENCLVFPEFRHSLPGTTALLAKSLAEEFLCVANNNIAIKNNLLNDVCMRDIQENEIFEAKEFLLLGTGPECVAITHYEGKAIGTGKPNIVAKTLKKCIHQALIDGGTDF